MQLELIQKKTELIKQAIDTETVIQTESDVNICKLSSSHNDPDKEKMKGTKEHGSISGVKALVSVEVTLPNPSPVNPKGKNIMYYDIFPDTLYDSSKVLAKSIKEIKSRA